MTDDTTQPDPLQLRPITDRSGHVLREARLERAAWTDPDDLDPSDVRGLRTRKARQIDGHRAVSVIHTLHRRSPDVITADYLRAAVRLTDDYELSEGARNSTAATARVDGVGGVGPTDGILDALARFRAATTVLGPLAAYVLPVVLSNWTVTRMAEAMLIVNPHHATAKLAAGLELLHDHYWPPVTNPLTSRDSHGRETHYERTGA